MVGMCGKELLGREEEESWKILGYYKCVVNAEKGTVGVTGRVGRQKHMNRSGDP